mmetsp:Transcript_25895/g.41681  ORF Transcript_25895/g.41681 Transcript_25895/m.41681 type:complete len:85 (+) Transcript_25895:1078-1332(+)
MEEWDEKKEAAALITAPLSSNSSSPQLHKESDKEEGETLRCWHRCSRFYNFFNVSSTPFSSSLRSSHSLASTAIKILKSPPTTP